MLKYKELKTMTGGGFTETIQVTTKCLIFIHKFVFLHNYNRNVIKLFQTHHLGQNLGLTCPRSKKKSIWYGLTGLLPFQLYAIHCINANIVQIQDGTSKIFLSN